MALGWYCSWMWALFSSQWIWWSSGKWRKLGIGQKELLSVFSTNNNWKWDAANSYGVRLELVTWSGEGLDCIFLEWVNWARKIVVIWSQNVSGKFEWMSFTLGQSCITSMAHWENGLTLALRWLYDIIHLQTNPQSPGIWIAIENGLNQVIGVELQTGIIAVFKTYFLCKDALNPFCQCSHLIWWRKPLIHQSDWKLNHFVIAFVIFIDLVVLSK